MKTFFKRFLWILFFLYSKGLLAQSFEREVASGKIYFIEEVPAKDAPVTDLYTRAKIWLKLPDPNQKKSEGMPSDNTLSGYQSEFLTFCDAGQVREIKIHYTVRLEMEDDRFWYRFSDFEVENEMLDKLEVKKIPLEHLLFPKTGIEIESQFQKNLKEAFVHHIQNSIISLKAALL